MVWEERFWEAQAAAAYKHHLLQEHLQVEEQLNTSREITLDAYVAEQAVLLESYRSAHLARRRYRQRVAEVVAAAYKEGDKAVFGETATRRRRTSPKPAHPRAPPAARKSSA